MTNQSRAGINKSIERKTTTANQNEIVKRFIYHDNFIKTSLEHDVCH